MKIILLSLLAVSMLFTGGNVLGMGNVHANYENEAQEIQPYGTCRFYRGWTTTVNQPDAFVRWTPTGANAGMIFRGARVTIEREHVSQNVRGWYWIQVRITGTNAQTNNGHWNNQLMWVATSQLANVPAGCR